MINYLNCSDKLLDKTPGPAPGGSLESTSCQFNSTALWTQAAWVRPPLEPLTWGSRETLPGCQGVWGGPLGRLELEQLEQVGKDCVVVPGSFRSS